MEFWNKKVNVSEEAARLQISIINKFDSHKKMRIALDFANMGIQQTREWIKSNNPYFSNKEVTLEFVRLMYYNTKEMNEDNWQHFKIKMEQKIKKEWSDRFRKMMETNQWTYDDIADLGKFKNGKVVEATISRGLPAFAKLAVMIHELKQEKKLPQ